MWDTCKNCPSRNKKETFYEAYPKSLRGDSARGISSRSEKLVQGISRAVVPAGFRPQECPAGPQLAAIHEKEAYSPVVGKLGMSFVENEYACGKAGVIPEPAHHYYVGQTLYRTLIGNEVIFYDPNRIPPQPEGVTNEDFEREMGCRDN